MPPHSTAQHGAPRLQVLQQLRAEGSKVWYRRLPLSRNRTPDASDMDVLHRCVFAAAAAGDAGVGVDVKFLLVARAAATSTSTSFVAHFLGLVLDALGDGDRDAPAAKARRVEGPASTDSPSISVVDNLCRRAPAAPFPPVPVSCCHLASCVHTPPPPQVAVVQVCGTYRALFPRRALRSTACCDTAPAARLAAVVTQCTGIPLSVSTAGVFCAHSANE